LSLTDQAIAFGAGQLEEAVVRQMLGSVDRSYVLRLIEALALGDGKTVVETSEALRLNGLSAASTLEEMSAVLQRMAVIQTVADAVGSDEIDPQAADTVRLAALMPPDETQLLYSICLHGRADLGLAPDEYAALTMVLLRLLAFKPAVLQTAQAEKKTLKSPAPEAPALPIQLLAVRSTPLAAQPVAARPSEPAARVDRAQAAGKVLAVPVRVQADSRGEAVAGESGSAVLRPTEEGDFWHKVVSQLIADDAITAMVRELALQSQLVAQDTDQWLLRVERESLNQAGSRDRLASALQAAGHEVRLVVEVGRVTDSPARRNVALASERQMAAEKIIFDDPFVQTMMRDFGAKIVPGSIKPG